MRIFSAGGHNCQCSGLPDDLKMEDIWLMGNKLFLEYQTKVDLCIQNGFLGN